MKVKAKYEIEKSLFPGVQKLFLVHAHAQLSCPYDILYDQKWISEDRILKNISKMLEQLFFKWNNRYHKAFMIYVYNMYIYIVYKLYRLKG